MLSLKLSKFFKEILKISANIWRKIICFNTGNIDDWKSYLSIAQSIVTIFALFAAGWFFLGREETAPRPTISIETIHISVSDGWNLVRIKVNISNTGKTTFSLKYGYIAIRRILPLEPAFVEMIQKNKSIIPPGGIRVPWKQIGDGHKFQPNIRLRSGEGNTTIHEFIISKNVEIIEAVAILALDANDQSSYSTSQIYDLR